MIRFLFQAEGNGLPNTFDQGIEFPGLGMAASQRRNSGDVKAVFVLFDHDSEFALILHEAILARRFWAAGAAAPT